MHEGRRLSYELSYEQTEFFAVEICYSKNVKPPVTLRQTNIAMENGPGLKMYFLSKMGISQPAMLVYQRVAESRTEGWFTTAGLPIWGFPKMVGFPNNHGFSY